MKKFTNLLLASALTMGAAAVQAQTVQTTFTVSANVQESCSVAATDLAFGPYLPTAGAPLDTSSTITVTCTNGATYGVDVGATPTNRNMTGPGGNLNYGMFNEVGRTTAFGVAGAAADGTAQAYTVFGRVPTAQFVTAGAYSATVTVTVTY